MKQKFGTKEKTAFTIGRIIALGGDAKAFEEQCGAGRYWFVEFTKHSKARMQVFTTRHKALMDAGKGLSEW